MIYIFYCIIYFYYMTSSLAIFLSEIFMQRLAIFLKCILWLTYFIIQLEKKRWIYQFSWFIHKIGAQIGFLVGNTVYRIKEYQIKWYNTNCFIFLLFSWKHMKLSKFINFISLNQKVSLYTDTWGNTLKRSFLWTFHIYRIMHAIDMLHYIKLAGFWKKVKIWNNLYYIILFDIL